MIQKKFELLKLGLIWSKILIEVFGLVTDETVLSRDLLKVIVSN